MKPECQSTLTWAGLAGQGGGSRTCISNKLTGDSAIPGPGWEPHLENNSVEKQIWMKTQSLLLLFKELKDI